MNASIRRTFSTFNSARHDNPLGLPRKNATAPPQVPRMSGPPKRRGVPNVHKVLAVASGKGGVGKSTVAVNLSFALAMHQAPSVSRLRVGILDLDIFGPSIPTIMGLQDADEPNLSSAGALCPLTNHGMPTMSMGYLLPRSPITSSSSSSADTAVVWRGLMVQKAVQQLLFDVDWTNGGSSPPLDVLVIDMPPGTGDVPLTLGQLVNVDGAVIVSTPQDVSLSDVRKGIAMLRKVSVPITGLVLNQSHFVCSSCTTRHPIFGSPHNFYRTSKQLGVDVLGELPVVSAVSEKSDEGVPFVLGGKNEHAGQGSEEWRENMSKIAGKVWSALFK